MIGFKSFIFKVKDLMLEKDMSDEQGRTLYVACKLPKTWWKKFADKVSNLKDAEEVETEPHCTLLWCHLENDYDTQLIYDTLAESLKDLIIVFKATEFEVFKGVQQGTQDALVVRLKTTGDIVELQKKLKVDLRQRGIAFDQTYPEWKPHMTIGYWKTGEPIEYEDEVDQEIMGTEVLIMKHNNGEELKF